MLKRLYIKNYTIIDSLDIEFNSGFSVITGETGAGKSIILGAIGMLLGQRADTKTIKEGCDKCIIEAHFDINEYNLSSFFDSIDIEYDPSDCIIRRELTITGKNRTFINDTPTQLSTLRELGERLIDIHSQHQNLLLGKQNFQLNVLDTIADNNNRIKEYRVIYNNYINRIKVLEELEKEISDSKSKADFLSYQFEELDNANLHDGEQEELEQKQEIMCHAEDIKLALFKTEAALTSENAGILDNLKTALSAISNIADILPEAISIKNRLDSNLIDLKDISYEVNKLQNHVDFNPSELEEINSRLDKIYELEQKYKCNSIQDLIKYHNELRSTIEKIDNYDFEVEQLKQDIKVLYDNCIKTANDISIHRKKAAQIIEGEIKEMLVKLGMPKVSFKVNVENDSLGRNGSDKVSFLFSANNNQLQNISEIASGGEISRVMLSLKAIINNYCNLPTIIFDEIDTGVSGKIAEMMAQIMLEMGNNNRQIICITHLPQIAAKGKEHFKVYKEITGDSYTSYMKHLNNDERITEIAQMLSGCDVTSAAINNAKELLNI